MYATARTSKWSWTALKCRFFLPRITLQSLFLLFLLFTYSKFTPFNSAHTRPTAARPPHAKVSPGQPYSTPTPALSREPAAGPGHCPQTRWSGLQAGSVRRNGLRSVLHLTWPPLASSEEYTCFCLSHLSVATECNHHSGQLGLIRYY